MKNVAVLLLAVMAIVMVGCSDESALPVSPADQTSVGAASLQKPDIREFSTIEGPDLSDPQAYIINGGFSPPHNKNKMIVRGMVVRNVVTATFQEPGPDYVSGHGILEMNFTCDKIANEGICWGKLTLDPDNPEVGPGVWEITWNGKITFDPSRGFVCPLKWVGQGKGGVIDGMQFAGNDQEMVIWSPFDGWMGSGTGFIKGH